MADYTKREMRKRDLGEQLARLRNERYTVFHNDYDPHLTVKGLTMEKAVRLMQERAGTTIFLWRSGNRWGLGENRPIVRKTLGADEGGKAHYQIFSTSADRDVARIELGHQAVLYGLGCFRGLPNLTFDENLLRLRQFLSLPRMAPAADYEAAKSQCLPRDLMNLGLYGSRMQQNILRAR